MTKSAWFARLLAGVFAVEALGDGQNLIVNGDFERDGGIPQHVASKSRETNVFTGWTANYYTQFPCFFEYCKTRKTSGEYAMRIRGEHGAAGQLFSNRFPVTPGKTYALSLQWLAEEEVGLSGHIVFFDAKGAVVGNKRNFYGTAPVYGKWAKLSDTFTAPALKDIVSASLYIRCEEVKALYIDDVVVAEAKPAAETAKGGGPTNMIEGGADFEAGLGMGSTWSIRSAQVPDLCVSRIDDAEAARGSRSLRVEIKARPLGYEPFLWWLSYPPISGFQEDRTYTLSVYAKSTRPIDIYLGVRGLAWAWLDGVGNSRWPVFTLSKEWKRYSATFRVPPGLGLYMGRCWAWIQLRPTINRKQLDGGAVTCWIDAVQINEGPLGEYADSTETALSVRAFPEDRNGIFYTDTADVLFRAEAYDQKSAEDLRVAYAVKDLYTEKTVAEGDYALERRDDKTHAAYIAKINNPGRGIYQMTATAFRGDKAVARAEYNFGFITKATSFQKNPNGFFGMNLKSFPISDWGGIETPKTERCVSYCAGSEPPRFYFELMKDIGVDWIRYFDIGYFWSENEYAPGRYRWAHDWVVKMAEEQGLCSLGVLWGGGGSGGLFIPDWAKSGKKNKTKYFTLDIPKDEAWRDYVYNMVKHYKGVEAWEILNEPASGLEPEEYEPLLKTAYGALKAARPEALAVTICGTSDYGDPAGWLKACLKLGAAKYSDVISSHYGALSMTTSTERSANAIRQLIRDAGKPHWNTEMGTRHFSSYSKVLPGYIDGRWLMAYEPLKTSPDYFLREQIFNMVEGGRDKMFFFLLMDAMCAWGEASLLDYNGTPKPQLIAYDVMADMLNDMGPGERVAMPGDVCCYLFPRKNRAPLAIMWNGAMNRDTLVCRIKARAETLRATNPVGGAIRLDGEKDETALAVSFSPFYLEAGARDYAEFRNILKNAVFDERYLPKLEMAGDLSLGWSEKVGAFVYADAVALQEKLAVDFAIKGLPAFIKAKNDATRIVSTVRGEMLKAIFPVSVDSERVESDKTFIAMDVSAGSETCPITYSTAFLKCVPAKTSVNLDGALDEWRSAPWVSMGHRQNIVCGDSSAYQGVADLSVKFAAMYNNDGVLYVAADVTDNLVTSAKDRPSDRLFETDSLELFFDLNIATDLARSAVDDSVFKIDVAPNDAPQGPSRIKLKCRGDRTFLERQERLASCARSVYAKTPGGYTVEIAVDLARLGTVPKPGAMIGFDFGANDRDKTNNRKLQMLWCSSTAEASANRAGYGRLIFMGR